MKSDLVAHTIAALRAHAPFDAMDGEALQFLAARLALAYYARGTLIASPQSGAADRLYIVKQGRVHGEDFLEAGECFPIDALIRRGPPVHEYRAAADVFCWELPAADFSALLARSAPFHAFCTNRLAALLERAHSHDAGMLAPLRSVLARPPVSCPPQTPIRQVLLDMRAQRIGSMVVAGADRVPLGIFTTVDVLEKIAAPQASVDAPVSALMTPRPVTLEEDATLGDAAIAMARHGIRHVIVTRDGRLTGVVSERDLFALQRVSLRRTAERIQAAGTAAELAEAAADVRALARHLLAQGIAAEPMTAMVSALNDALSHRLIEIFSQAHSLGGHWCWIALGSEGRKEQTFATDQDNALIFEHGAKERLLAFADGVNRALDAAGFPLCKGEIMARNPRWCLGAGEWRAVFESWIRNPHPEALLNASIFFDLRPLAGEASLCGELRDSVLAPARANRSFLRAMTENALRSAPPLGWLKDFSAEQLDLKGSGARPFVDAARVLALAQGSAETGTAPRLRASGEAGSADAFHFIQGLRLRHGNSVSVERLSALERRVLKEAFREGARLQSRIRLDFSA